MSSNAVIEQLLRKEKQYRAETETTAEDIILGDGMIVFSKDTACNVASLYDQLIAATETYLSSLNA